MFREQAAERSHSMKTAMAAVPIMAMAARVQVQEWQHLGTAGIREILISHEM